MSTLIFLIRYLNLRVLVFVILYSLADSSVLMLLT